MINIKSLNDTVTEALNNESRLAITEEAQRVMNLAGKAIRLVQIDEKMLKNIVSNIIKSYNCENDKGVFRGIINPFLGIFGLKIVSRKDGSGKAFASSETSQMPIINADIEELKKIFHDIASEVDTLADQNVRNQARIHEIELNLNNAVCSAERAKNQLSAEQSEAIRSETESLKYFQRMLAEFGKDNPPDADGAFGQLLEVLNVTFSWDYENHLTSFQTYIISDKTRAGVSLPCLLKGDVVVVKGLVYTVKPTS